MSGNILFGKPRIKGTRISVEQVLSCIAEGWSNEKIVEEFEIAEEDIRAAVNFAYGTLSHTQFFSPLGTPNAPISD